MKEQITESTHPSMYAWLDEWTCNELFYDTNPILKKGKLIIENNQRFQEPLHYIKYPYIDVDFFGLSNTNNMFLINSAINIKDEFYCDSSQNLLSFKGFPKKIKNNVGIWDEKKIENYSLIYKDKDRDRYQIYLAMWLEVFDSITEKERWEYINEFKNREHFYRSIIPNEILVEFGVL